MIVHRCDGCGKELAEGELRYTVKIDVKAAYDEMEIGLADLVRDHRAEMLALIERLKDKDPKEIEETVYKGFKLDLCPACQRRYIRDPLRFNRDGDAPDPPFDVNGFLRSLRKDGPEDSDT